MGNKRLETLLTYWTQSLGVKSIPTLQKHKEKTLAFSPACRKSRNR